MEQVERQVDKTAFLLIYRADQLYKELNRTESAVAAYKEIIQLFPTNRWAEVARERLAEIDKHRSEQIGS
jgi:outer membrane protein assembly factor BamD (BamD/ComL family)